MKIKAAYDASFAVNNYRGMGVFINALKDVLAQYDNIDITGVCNCTTTDAGVIKIGSGAYPIWEQISLPLYLKKNKQGAFIFPYNTMPFLLPKQLKKILVLHDVIFLEKIPGARYSPRQLGGKFYRKFLIANAFKKADVIITVSEYSKKRIQELLGNKDKIYVIPNAIKDIEADKVNSNKTEDYIFNVGGEAPNKNILALIKAYILLPPAIINKYRLNLVGNYSASFINKANSLLTKNNVETSRVNFMGYVDDKALADLYIGCSLFIFPSLYEGFGIPVIEAMKFNKPLLVSNTSCIPEIAGQAGLYFNPLLIDDIKNKIEFALSSSYNFELYNQYYKKQLEKFSMKEFIKKVSIFIENELLN